MMIRQEIIKLIEIAVKELQKDGVFAGFVLPEIHLERPEESRHGDYSTSIAMAMAKSAKKNPAEIAKILSAKIQDWQTGKRAKLFEKIETAGPGFVNFFISQEYLQSQIGEITKQKDKFGNLKTGKNKKINVEFISANPTGPLHVGNGRGGFCGDVLANVLKKAGYNPFREYYVNDMGRQVVFLKNSLEGKQPSYQNPYIDDLRKKKIRDPDEAIKIIVGKIKKTAKKAGIEYDRWFFESELYKKDEIKNILTLLKKKNLVYEKEGALWLKSTDFGDDKDRVIKRAKEKTLHLEETYFLSDIAYLQNKLKRGFVNLIIFLGAEHHGYVPRLKAAVQALGYDQDIIRPIVYQLVRLIEEGKEVKMSKRTGVFVTLDELIDEVGKDAARFFFLERSYGNHLTFDLGLAKQQSEKNPVYYVQYASARISSILKKSKSKNEKNKTDSLPLNLLVHPSELALIKQFIRFPEIIEETAQDYQVHRLPQYSLDLATAFHRFYKDCRVISEDKDLTRARLALVLAAQIILKNTLDLMGIIAPEKM